MGGEGCGFMWDAYALWTVLSGGDTCSVAPTWLIAAKE